MTKYIFVTGGVVSSLGKGIAAASIGKLMEWNGYKVAMIKCDPYINVDPGTMNPYQHGEVYVTDDGAETDLDLGHYFRYTNSPLGRISNVTTGKVYQTVITKERRGDFLGGTVQVIPHITNEIKSEIRDVVKKYSPDILIVEIGGTVGDIEGMPFLEAIRQMKLEEGAKNALNIHLTLVPFIKAAGEIKTKPTQHSVGKMREIGIQPEILMIRTEIPLSDDARYKISLFCNVEKSCVIEALDVPDIYEIPLMFRKNKLDSIILDKLCLKPKKKVSSGQWEKVVHIRKTAKQEVRIGVVGKYITLQDAYKSIDEALKHGAIANNLRIDLVKIESDNLEKKSPAELDKFFDGIDGILVPGGFGVRGIEGKLTTARYAREKGVPYFGICLGMQIAVIEFARNVMGLKGANSTEFDPKTKYPVISLLSEQEHIKFLGGTMRLGEYKCALKPGTKARSSYGSNVIFERHRHRYEFNSAYKNEFQRKGLIVSGTHPKGNLVEMIEIKSHPWFVAVQSHPEFKSKPDKVHPLFRDFLKAAYDYNLSKIMPDKFN
ncbi:MAG: CTP synthase [Candidatus Omnitrophica bacterium]|nr:CTP synthase [Candidatus Omnitrophota bacterium]